MENNTNVNEEISLQELLQMLWRNRYILTTFVVLGLILSLLLSGVQALRNPGEYQYQAKVTLELLNEEGATNQPETLLRVIESSKLLEAAKTKLKITGGDYLIRTEISTKPNQFDVIAEGPDKDLIVELVNEVTAQGRAAVTGALTMQSNAIAEAGRLFGTPVKISKSINVLMNLILGAILGGMLGVFVVFVVLYLGGKVHSEDEVESILGVKVLGSLPLQVEEAKYAKFTEVR